MPVLVSFFESKSSTPTIRQTKGQPTDLSKIIRDIKAGEYATQVSHLRSLPKKEANEGKKFLPAFTPSGVFSIRKEDGLSNHSAIIVLDFDDLENPSDIRDALSLDKWIYSAFISPLGRGVKAFVRIDPTKHKESFLNLADHYEKTLGIRADESGKDLCRLCFVSSDNDAYFNEDADTFILTTISQVNRNIASTDTFFEIETITQRIEDKKIDITGDYKQWVKLGFSLSSGLGEKGRSIFHRLSSFYTSYSEDESDKQYTECVKGKKSGVTLNTFFYLAQQYGIDTVVKKPGRIGDKKKVAAPGSIVQKGDNGHKFWNIVERTNSDGSKQFKGIEIDKLNLLTLLFKFGFRRFDISNGFSFVRVMDNIIQEVTTQQIQDSLFDHLKSLPEKLEKNVSREDVTKKVLNQIDTLFGKSLLSTLRNESAFSFNNDLREKSFVYYQNGFVKCTPGKYDFHPYSELQKAIWKERIIKRDFRPLPIDTTGNFERFIENICSQDKERKLSLMTIIGYLLHDYTEGKMKAVVLTDSKISEENEGRTGKTLFGKALKHIRNVCELPGKDFKADDKFKYQGCQISTQIMFLNDARERFKLEWLYNDITEGITIEKKNQSPIIIRVKYLITSNKTLKTNGASSRDRVIEFEFADYYSDKFSPQDEFKQWFFTEWDELEWLKFDNFIMNCLALYLEQGIYEVNPVNLQKRKLIDQSCKQFYDFIQSGEIKPNEEFCLQTITETFSDRFPDYEFRTAYPSKKVCQWLKILPSLTNQFFGLEMKHTKKSNGANFYIFSK